MPVSVRNEHTHKMTDSDRLNEILKSEAIVPAYQPIVSLRDGHVYGYEALSRISNEAYEMNVENLFRTADESNRSWELETLCREKALECATLLGAGKKLFLNVNPNIIYDEAFHEGFTKSRLDKYGLCFNDIVFEITERIAIIDNDLFLESIDHYRKQHFRVAIDDVGAGYSGLNVIANVCPDLIKLDMHLIRDIDKDEVKQHLLKALIDFCMNTGIESIAEGVETEMELKTLINLNVDNAQGYFLSRPHGSFKGIAMENVELIQRYWEMASLERRGIGIGLVIGDLISGMHHLLTADQCLLKVDYYMPVVQVARLATRRKPEQLCDPIIIIRNGIAAGFVTVKDILEIMVSVYESRNESRIETSVSQR